MEKTNNMLDHLHIQNYRLFKDFKIEGLGQINLIAGKNNAGKTSLLEAIMILRSESELYNLSEILSQIVKKRGEINSGFNRRYTMKSVFYNRDVNENSRIKINNLIIKPKYNDSGITEIIKLKNTKFTNWTLDTS